MMNQELILLVKPRAGGPVTDAHVSAICGMLEDAFVEGANEKEAQRERGEATKTFVPAIARVVRMTDKDGHGDIRVIAENQDSLAWARGVLNARDGPFLTMTYTDIPKWSKCAMFVPKKLLSGGVRAWWDRFRAAARGHYQVRHLEFLTAHDQMDLTKDELAGKVLVFCTPKAELTKLAKRSTTGDSYVTHYGSGRFDIRLRGETIPPVSVWEYNPQATVRAPTTETTTTTTMDTTTSTTTKAAKAAPEAMEEGGHSSASSSPSED
jgi:hypothetical protein